MVVERGYKQTDLGVLPENWQVVPISHAGLLINGRGFKPFEWSKSGLPIIRIQNLNGSDDFNYYSGSYDKKIEIHEAQLLFAWSGSRGTSFGPHIWNGPKGLLNYHTWKVVIKENIVNKDYFLHILRKLTKVIENEAHGASALVHVQKWQMEKFSFPLPPLPEQTAIANALSDMDALIAQTEKIIEKKKAIKQGVMQELLRPKEGWVKCTIDSCCDILNNFRKPLNDSERQKMRGDIPYCGANGVVDYIDEYLTDFDMILMAEDGGYFDEFKTRPIAYRMSGKCWVNNHAHILKAKNQFDQDFIYYSIVHKNILDYINGGTRAKLNKSELKNIVIHCPDKETQETISMVFNQIEILISSMKSKLQKLKLQKQGMMQALLTGKIRLV